MSNNSDENGICENSTRAQYYDDLWKRTPTVQIRTGGELGPRYLEVFYKSNTQVDRLPVKEIPIDLDDDHGLRFNPSNSRILAYKRRQEATLATNGNKRSLSSENQEDQNFIYETLIDNKFYSTNATSDLKNDLKLRGQIEPAIISVDGTIWNANRRIAVRHQLYKETGDPKWNKVLAVRLPSLSFKELKQLEHRLQMSKEFRETYGSITLRLRCRDAIQIEHWSMQELINSFHDQHSQKEIEKFIKEIDLIDEFLEYTRKQSDYPFIQSKAKGKGVQIFTELNDQITWEKNNGTSDANIENIKHIGFSIIHNQQTTYQNVRLFKNILREEKTRTSLLDNSKIFQNPDEYLISDNDGVSPKALKPEVLESEFNNLEKEGRVYESLKNEPSEIMDEIYSKLMSIDLAKITPNDELFNERIPQIVSHIDVLCKQCTFTHEEKNKLSECLKKFLNNIDS